MHVTCQDAWQIVGRPHTYKCSKATRHTTAVEQPLLAGLPQLLVVEAMASHAGNKPASRGHCRREQEQCLNLRPQGTSMLGQGETLVMKSQRGGGGAQ